MEKFGENIKSNDYETLDFDKTSTGAFHAQEGNIYTRKKKICKIIMAFLIITVITALATSLGLTLTSQSQAEHKSCPLFPEESDVLIVDSASPSVGDVVKIQCANNKTLFGPSSIICLSSGEWSATPLCKQRQCMPFQLPQNADLLERKETGTNIGTELNLYCNAGFILNGSTNVICLNNGTWSISPTCVARDCGMPLGILNGYFSNIFDTLVNSSLQISCNPGYTLSSESSTIVCNENGIWDALPKCLLWFTNYSSEWKHFFMNGTGNGDIALIRCDEGFYLQGTNTIYCTQNNTWTPIPECKDIYECESSPCANGATCNDQFNGYTCNCTSGWSGTHCDQDILECASSPCPNGATCIEQFNGYMCNCTSGWSGTHCDQVHDCRALRDSGLTANGIYTVLLKSSGLPIQVYCDMQTNGGGWTVFQNRFNGSLKFNRSLKDFENGFGDLNGEFWIGLKFVQEMVLLGPTELRLDVSSVNLATFYSVYQNFNLGADNLFILHIGGRSGSVPKAPDQTLVYHNGSCFSTYDRDCGSRSCPADTNAGWWVNNCFYVNLNGVYMTRGIEANLPGKRLVGGNTHYGFMSSFEALLSSKMMYRRVKS